MALYRIDAAGELDCSCAAECPCAVAEVARLRRALEDVRRAHARALATHRPALAMLSIGETVRRALDGGRLEVTPPDEPPAELVQVVKDAFGKRSA